MRVQASMTITDLDLYEQVIEPKKASKEFNSLLVHLLDAYYHNYNGIREYIDGGGFTDEIENISFDDKYEEVRELLTGMDILIEDTGNLFSESERTFTEYMEGAVESGIVQESSSNNDDTEISVSLKKPSQEEKPQENNTESIDLQAVLNELRTLGNTVSSLARDVENLKRTDVNSFVDVKSDVEKEEVNTEKTVPIEVSNEQDVFEQGNEEVYVEEVEENSNEEPVFYEEEVEVELPSSMPGEATSAMQSLLGSLDF